GQISARSAIRRRAHAFSEWSVSTAFSPDLVLRLLRPARQSSRVRPGAQQQPFRALPVGVLAAPREHYAGSWSGKHANRQSAKRLLACLPLHESITQGLGLITKFCHDAN